MFKFVLAAMAALFAFTAPAQEFPNKPVRIIVLYSAGGAADVVGRILAHEMGGLLRQPFIVENRGGAGGILGIEALVKAPSDGHTLVIADAGHWAINPALYPKLPYDAEQDLAPIGMITTQFLFLVVNESVPARNLRELVGLIRSKPGGLNYGSSGNGSVHHLTMEAFKSALGLDIVHVPYKGTAPAIAAVAGGQVSMAIGALASVAPFEKQGKLRLIAVSAGKRSPNAPDIPSMAEAGIPDFDFPGELALFARAGTPRTIIDQLAKTLAKAVSQPDAITRFRAGGVEPVGGTPEQLAETMRSDIRKYARSVKAAGAKVD